MGLNLYLNYIRPKVIWIAVRMNLNDKQGKNKEKVKNGLCNNLGSEQREVPGLTCQRQVSFSRIPLTPQKNPLEI